jgi:hypothetical protein
MQLAKAISLYLSQSKGAAKLEMVQVRCPIQFEMNMCRSTAVRVFDPSSVDFHPELSRFFHREVSHL